MSACEDKKQQIIEGFLENEALTDGLSDEDAQSVAFSKQRFFARPQPHVYDKKRGSQQRPVLM